MEMLPHRTPNTSLALLWLLSVMRDMNSKALTLSPVLNLGGVLEDRPTAKVGAVETEELVYFILSPYNNPFAVDKFLSEAIVIEGRSLHHWPFLYYRRIMRLQIILLRLL